MAVGTILIALQTAAQLEAFFLAMSLYPEVQAAAQEELDRVVGNDRLPDISDRSQLPYVDALCKEVLRWHVAIPIGIYIVSPPPSASDVGARCAPSHPRGLYLSQRRCRGAVAYSQGLFGSD